MLWGYSALKKTLLGFARKTHLAELPHRPGLDHRGLSCVSDDDSHPLQQVAIERPSTLAFPAALLVAMPAIATQVIPIRILAPRATVKTPEHPHQNTPAAMALGQILLCLSPEFWRGASCDRASIYACLACNTLTYPRATLGTKPDSRNVEQPLRTENVELITDTIKSPKQHKRTRFTWKSGPSAPRMLSELTRL